MLYPSHLDDIHLHAHAAGEDAAVHLSSDFQEHARTFGLPDDLVDDLRVRYDHTTGEFHPGVKNPDNHERLLDIEYGDGHTPPRAVMRTFNSTHAEKAADHYGNALMRQLA